MVSVLDSEFQSLGSSPGMLAAWAGKLMLFFDIAARGNCSLNKHIYVAFTGPL